MFSSNASEVAAVGMIRATIRSRIDIILLAKRRKYNLWYEVADCGNGERLSSWSPIYRNETGGSQSTFDLLFDYKSTSEQSYQYDLSSKLIELCFTIGGASMAPFSGGKWEKVRVSLQPDLINSLVQYETSNGPIALELADSCKHTLCTPDYGL